MFPFLKRKSTFEEPFTLKKRVQLFWDWYAEVAARYLKAIDAGRCSTLTMEMSSKVDELLPGFAWVFGPGENGGHSFTLSAEGNPHGQRVALYWLSLAPTFSGWTFYAARQPGPIKGHYIKIGDHKFDPMEFWLIPAVNEESEKVDITVWHPLFEKLPEKDRWTVLFLFLDEVLGEYGTQQWIGQIAFDGKRLGDAMPISELLNYVRSLEVEKGWKKYLPGQLGSIYSIEQQHELFLRGDIVAGSTTHYALIDEYGRAEGELSDPLAGLGADYVFITFDVSILSQGNQTAERGEIEEALDEALKAEFSGQSLGGAIGTRYAYIDLMLYDGRKSLDLVRQVLNKKKLPPETEIHFFAKEKRGHRLILEG